MEATEAKHKITATTEWVPSVGNVTFTHVTRDFLKDIELLQLELFPIRYPRHFYEDLFKEGYLTLIATIPAAEARPKPATVATAATTFSDAQRESLLGGHSDLLPHVEALSKMLPGLRQPATESTPLDNEESSNGKKDILVGCCTGRLVVEDQAPWWWFWGSKTIKSCYIMTIGVAQQYRRYGLATMLLQRFESQLAALSCGNNGPETEFLDCSKLTLHCKVDNDSALKFYAKNGYTTESLCPQYYNINGVDEDAYFLSKPLQRPSIIAQWLPHSNRSSTAIDSGVQATTLPRTTPVDRTDDSDTDSDTDAAVHSSDDDSDTDDDDNNPSDNSAQQNNDAPTTTFSFFTDTVLSLQWITASCFGHQLPTTSPAFGSPDADKRVDN